MKLTVDQAKQISEFLRTKWQSPATCPVCRSNNWSVSQEVYELREFQGGNMVLGGSAIAPIIPVTCTVCGNTITINAIIAGVDLKGA